ncbi:hypothetical protein [Streptomyces sp. NPDC001297]|uniref:hypothetical protein n=1 Tax=Streptomyces sp. NPDC001297 TaxID=3364559 RepID=UPI0036863793
MTTIRTNSTGTIRTDRTRPSGRISLPAYASPTVFAATPEGVVVLDLVAVDQAVNGDRRGWRLTEDEARYAASLLLDHDVAYSVISARVGRNTDTLRAWFPDRIEPVTPAHARGGPRGEIEHGTPRGYRTHLRRGEKTCQPCRDANAVKDRQYRRGGHHRKAVAA